VAATNSGVPAVRADLRGATAKLRMHALVDSIAALLPVERNQQSLTTDEIRKESTSMRKTLLRLFSAAALLGALSDAARADGALDQLKRANSGSQATGKTFDGANKPLPTDAYPKATGALPSQPRSNSPTPPARPVSASGNKKTK
jgi:hypothetical protein